MREIKEIILHCSATPKGWMQSSSTLAKAQEIARWHTENNGWRAIGYHYLIDRNGQLANGRPVEQVGAHTRGRNKHSIGICLIGGHGGASTDDFSDHFTAEQKKTLLQLIGELKERHKIGVVTGHNDYAAKACPCFDVHAFLAEQIVEPHIIDEPVSAPVEHENVSFWGALAQLIASLFGGRK